MKNSRSLGIATAVLAIIAVVVIAAIGTAAYFAFNSGGTTSTLNKTTTTGGAQTSVQSSTHSATTSSTHSATTASSLTSTKATSAASSSSGAFDANGLVRSMDNLIGNFSQMTVEYSSTSNTTTSNSLEDFTYVVVGHPFANSTHFTEVNFSSTSSGSGSSSNSSAVLWFNPQGNVTLVQESGQNYTGSYANIFAYAYTAVFQLFFTDASSLVNAYSSLSYQGSSTQSFGNTQLSVSTYSWNYLGVGTYTIGVGNLAGTGVYLVTNWAATSGGNGAAFKLISLTKA